MPYDKNKIIKERGAICECGCGRVGQDAHHALIGRRKKFPELDCPENIVIVNHVEHVLRKFDNIKWRIFFWEVQCKHYGYEHMIKWVESLPEKLKYRIDFVQEKRG